MKHYCQTKEELLKEIKWWIEHLEGDEIEIIIKPDNALEKTFILEIYEKQRIEGETK